MIEKILLKVARQWIAGQTVNEALLTAKQAYKNGRHAIVNKLGEYHTSKKVIAKTVDEYQLIIDSFRKWKIRGAISVKPTQVGLSISQKEGFRKIEKIISRAQKAHVFVWFDRDTTRVKRDAFANQHNRFGIAAR